ncbi:uptake hydrogenase large subunit [Marssonina coronariae]|uniref:Uptake hydrogenase large subunit n=1 Tax=Diplocarpon coronariae TaxID=2795749 RepID=A0A218Z3U3_9HELO|nr:uptake hydrogenase large subunit [Marssonina coronariae]
MAEATERGDLIESQLARLEQSSRTMLSLLGSIAALAERTAVAAESLIGGGGLAVARVASGAAASRAAPAAARGGGRGRSGRGRI